MSTEELNLSTASVDELQAAVGETGERLYETTPIFRQHVEAKRFEQAGNAQESQVEVDARAVEYLQKLQAEVDPATGRRRYEDPAYREMLERDRAEVFAGRKLGETREQFQARQANTKSTADSFQQTIDLDKVPTNGNYTATPPAGYELDTQAPLFAKAQAYAAKAGFTQRQFNAMVELYAQTLE